MTGLTDIQVAMSSKDEETRRRGIQELRGKPLHDCCEILFSAMGDESWRVRKEAVEVFVTAAPTHDLIVELLELLRNEDNAGLRNSAAEAVARIGEQAATPLIALSTDSDADVRKFVIDVMGSINSPQFIPSLLARVADSDVNVAAAAAEHLGNLGDPRIVPVLLASLQHNVSDLFRFNILATVGKLAEPGPVPDELYKLADNELLQKAVYECLGSIADETALPLLLDGLSSGRKSCRNAAVTALQRVYSRAGNNSEARRTIESALSCLKGSDQVPALMKSFDAGDPKLAEALIELLDIIGDKRSVDVLLTAFGNERLSAPALRALKHLGPDGIDALIERFAITDELSRSAICALIGECAYRNGSPVLHDGLNDKSAVVRRAAATAIGKLGLTNCIPGVVNLLNDADQQVRYAAVTCLEALALINRTGIQLVARQLGDSDQPEQRRNAAILFAALGDGDRLTLLVKDEDPLVRQAAVTSVGKLRLPTSSGTLVIALSDEDPDVRIAAAEALAHVGDVKVITALTHALADDDVWVQCAVLKSLTSICPEETLNAVRSVFTGAEGLLMITCLKLLEELSEEGALDLVEHALDNNDEEVVTLALSIIGRHAPERIVPQAEFILRHRNWDVRMACARTVALLPPEQAGTLLERALAEEDNDLVRNLLISLLKGLS